MITCTFSGIRYHLSPAPARLQWPHPALAYGFDFPKNNPAQTYLRFAAALFAMHRTYPSLLQTRSPLRKENFSNTWLSSSIYALEELNNHLQGCGTHRLHNFPTLVLSKNTGSDQIAAWMDECAMIAQEYQQLSTVARDIANTKHAIMIRARNKAILGEASNSRTFNAYLERCAVDCGVDGEARYQFLRTCRNPAGSTDRAIKDVLALLQDWAPQESIDDQLDFEVVVQRLSDAILDSAAKQAAKQQQMNIELSKGLFRTRIAATPTTASSSTVQPLPSAQIKQREQNNTLAQLQAMLAKVDALKEAGKL
jgi:hypothetical protein